MVFVPSAVSGAVQYAEAPAWRAHQLCSDLIATLEGPDEGNVGHGIRAGSWPPSLRGSAAACASRSAPRQC